VRIRRGVLLVMTAAVFAGLSGCSSNNSKVQNPTAPLTSTVSIAFQPAPAPSLLVNTSTSLTAVVSNDSSNSGVDWSLSCLNAGNCGTLSAPHTASGQANTYAPSPSLSGNSQAVNIVAYATADHSQNVVAPITITAFGSNLKGTYVLQAQGVDASSNPYQYAGVIVLDGNGGILSGEQTINFFDPNTNINALVSKADVVMGGTYFLGPDGRGTISISTNNQDLGNNGVESFSFVFLSSSQALITALPTSTLLFSATGTMDLQTSTAAPAAGYAFVVSGTDFSSGSPTSIGGVFNIDSPNTISGKGSVADQNLSGTVTAQKKLSGIISNPDSFGAVTLNLAVPTFTSTTAFQFTGYIVDATHIKLIESDNPLGSFGAGCTSGLAIGQGAATGSFTSDASFSGTYVFGVLGEDLTAFTPASFTSAGVFTADGSGNLANGFTDTLLQANGIQGTAGTQISAAFRGTYAVDVTGTGRLRSTFVNFVPAPKPDFQPEFYFYLTGNGNPALVLDGGDISGAFNYPNLGAGTAYPQAPAPVTFGGKYGFSLTQQNGGENEGTGVITADPTSGTLSGSLDANLAASSAALANPFTGTIAPPDSTGRFAGTFNGQVFEFSPFAVDYYIIDPSHGFFVETDLVNATAASGVVSFGYYAARTPVCATCF